MICLVCSDFPRSLICETVKTLPLSGSTAISTKSGHELLFEQFDIERLQGAVCIFFYYNEFMEQVRTLFMETAAQTTLNINEQCSLKLIYNGVSNLISRLRLQAQPLPQAEAILEILISKSTDSKATQLLDLQPLVVSSDLVQYLTG